MMIFDIETDGLDPSKIHCMSWTTDGKSVSTTHDYKLMSQILLRQKGLIGHNIVRYDVPVLERIIGIKIKDSVVFKSVFGKGRIVIHFFFISIQKQKTNSQNK